MKYRSNKKLRMGQIYVKPYMLREYLIDVGVVLPGGVANINYIVEHDDGTIRMYDEDTIPRKKYLTNCKVTKFNDLDRALETAFKMYYLQRQMKTD